MDPKISIVIPVYNEEESVFPLYKQITEAMEKYNLSHELILVDDGSSDSTFLHLEKIAMSDSKVKVIKLKMNSGQTAALHAGFENAVGEIIVSMDGDLQNDPDDIDKFIRKIEEGYDIVVGWRHNRHDYLITRKIPSLIANGLIRKVTGIPVRDNGCALRAYRRELIMKIPLYSEMHRLLPVITALSGARFTQLEVKHHARQFGHSKYGLSRIYKVLFDITALKTYLSSFYIPLFGFGFFSLFFGFLCIITFIITMMMIALMPNPNLIIVIGIGLLFGEFSAFLFSLGLICHLIYGSGNLKIEKLYRTKIK